MLRQQHGPLRALHGRSKVRHTAQLALLLLLLLLLLPPAGDSPVSCRKPAYAPHKPDYGPAEDVFMLRLDAGPALKKPPRREAEAGVWKQLAA